MPNYLPGSTLEVDPRHPEQAEALLRSLFLAGGLVRSQVSCITGLAPYDIQNWVKRGFLPPPVKKKYSRSQLCRILIINMLRASMQMEHICALLAYINGKLDDESDDSIDDSELYLYFVRLGAHAALQGKTGDGDMEDELELVLRDFRETVPGSRERIRDVLRVMVIAERASHLTRRAEELMPEFSN